MISDQTALIDDLLSRWHRWATSSHEVEGYPTECPSCRDFRTSRQYDDSNGALDANLDARMMTAIDALIDRIPQPHRTALQFNARNLCTNAQVWASPRLPKGEALVTMIVEARTMFAELLG